MKAHIITNGTGSWHVQSHPHFTNSIGYVIDSKLLAEHHKITSGDVIWVTTENLRQFIPLVPLTNKWKSCNSST